MKRTLLVAALTVAVIAVGASYITAEPTYIGAGKCKPCHKTEYDSWVANATHAKSMENAKASTNPKWDATCVGCHATNKNEMAIGVECESCHGAGSDYKTIAVMKDRAKAVAAGLVIPDQKTCDGCHDGKDHHKKVDIKTAPAPHAKKPKATS